MVNLLKGFCFLFFFRSFSVIVALDSKFLFKAFSDSFLGHFLLYSHFKLVSESDAGDIDFGDKVDVFSILVSVKYKVNSPVQKCFDISKFLSEVVKV